MLYLCIVELYVCKDTDYSVKTSNKHGKFRVQNEDFL